VSFVIHAGGSGVSVLWDLQPATAAKHRLYKSYLDAWWPILLQPFPNGRLRPRVTYVDAFAGPGQYTGGEEGSPVFALDRLLNHDAVDRMHLSRERVCMIFMEENGPRHEHLLRELTHKFGMLDDLPVRVEVRKGEAGTDLAAVLDEVSAWGQPLLAVFDSWGNVNVPLTLVRRISHNPSSEVITTFAPNWFSRRQEQDPAQLDAVFGGREFWVPAGQEGRPDERWRTWLSTYRVALRRAGFKYQLQFQVVPRTGQPLYLVFGTGHEKGVQVMKDAMWDVDGSQGMHFRDPRTRGAVGLGQQTIWQGAGLADPELHELVRQRLAAGPASLEELGQWLLLETARWRARDAKVAVKDLQNDGAVSVQPPGRLLRASVITLR
jgi:three-Cys-motif partner protein